MLSVLNHFDVVGLTERFDESLLMLGHVTGMRHLGYARLAANNKPRHPALAKTALERMLLDTGAPSLSVAVDVLDSGDGRFRRGPRSWASAPNASAYSAAQPWSRAAIDAMAALNDESLDYVLRRQQQGTKPGTAEQLPKVDCNFYPCTEALEDVAARVVTPTVCAPLGAGKRRGTDSSSPSPGHHHVPGMWPDRHGRSVAREDAQQDGLRYLPFRSTPHSSWAHSLQPPPSFSPKARPRSPTAGCTPRRSSVLTRSWQSCVRQSSRQRLASRSVFAR